MFPHYTEKAFHIQDRKLRKSWNDRGLSKGNTRNSDTVGKNQTNYANDVIRTRSLNKNLFIKLRDDMQAQKEEKHYFFEHEI
jgi:hypothetical protein